MKHPLFVAGLFGFLILLPVAAVIARPQTEVFRQCTREAYSEYYDAILDSTSATHDALEQAAEERRVAYADSWETHDDADQRRAERDADRAFRQRSVDIHREQSLRERERRNTFLDDKRACRDLNRVSSSSSSSVPDCPEWPICMRARLVPGCTCSQP